jgi:hypothetical protein
MSCPTLRCSLDVVGEPAEAIAIARFPHDAAHEELHRADPVEGDLALACRALVQAELAAQLILRGGAPEVDFVAEDEEGHISKVLAGQQGLIVEAEGAKGHDAHVSTGRYDGCASTPLAGSS